MEMMRYKEEGQEDRETKSVKKSDGASTEGEAREEGWEERGRPTEEEEERRRMCDARRLGHKRNTITPPKKPPKDSAFVVVLVREGCQSASQSSHPTPTYLSNCLYLNCLFLLHLLQHH